MKKYSQPAVKILAALTALCCLMIVAGIALIVFAPQQQDYILLFLGMGIPFPVIFAAILIPTARNYLLLGSDKIVFPITRAPKLKLSRNTVEFSQIKYIQVDSYKGDGDISKDTVFYCFALNNGIKFFETFYHYGKSAEKEIVALLQEHVRFI